MRSKTVIILAAVIVAALGLGIALRPDRNPADPPTTDAQASILTPQEPRGVQYFRAHVEEARQTHALCEQGQVRGQECAHAEAAIAEVDGKARFKRFMGH